jgi:hypothetical protein
MKYRKPKSFTPKKDQIRLDRIDRLMYLEYGKRWEAGESIPKLAEEAGCTNREMHSSIALHRKVILKPQID